MRSQDEFSGRAVAEDAWPPLLAFREGGGRSFHEFPVEEVRTMYSAYTAVSGLHESSPPEHRDHVVGECGVRVYDPRPAGSRNAPTAAIQFMHGGGWLMGGLDTHHSAARRLAVQTGLPVMAVDYRLAPEHRYPAAVEDCRQAMTWLVDREDVHGLLVSSIVFVGDSAGGQLAAVLTNETVVSNEVPVAAQVLLYPITDLTDENMEQGFSYRRITEGFPMVADTMRWFADTYVDRGDIRRNPDLSPLHADLPEGLPPTFVITVDNDPLADEGGRYAAALAAAGTQVRYEHLVGYAHGLFTSAGRIPAGETYLSEVAEFICRHVS